MDRALRAFCSTSSTVSPSSTDQVAQQVEDLRDDPRRQPEAGLVEQQHPRRGHQRPADDEHLPLAAGEDVGGGVAPVGERREQVVDALEVVGAHPGAAAQAAEPEVLLDGELGDHARVPRGRGPGRWPASARPAARSTSPAVELDLAAVGPEQPGDGAQQGGLAGAVGAEHGGDLPGGRGEGDVRPGPGPGRSWW